MDSKLMLQIAERIACRHQKLSTTQVTDLCLKIKSAYDTMVASDAPVPKQMAEWFNPDTINCRCFVKPISVDEQPVGSVLEPLTEAPPIPGTEPLWIGANELIGKHWRDDEAIEISYGMDGRVWRGTIHEFRDSKFPHQLQSANKWRFLKCEPAWRHCINVTHRPSEFNDVHDDVTMVGMYYDSHGGHTYKAQRLSDVSWGDVLAVKRVLE